MIFVAFVFLNAAACAACAALELRDAWKGASPKSRRLWLGATALCFSAALFFTRGTPLRSGWPNETGFQLFELDLLSMKPSSTLKLGEDAGKELSPLAFKRGLEVFTGRSLDRLVWAQELLWLCCALLAAGTLRRAGAGAAAALLGGAFLLLNFLSILNTHALATTNINVFYFLCAVYALSARSWSWFLCASFLTFTARYELIPILAWGALLVWREKPRRPAKPVWWQAGATALGLAIWASTLLQDKLTSFEVAHPWTFVSNVNFQLGTMNLAPVTGLPAWAAFPLLAAAAFLLLRLPIGRFWGAFIAGWLLYLAAIFSPTSVHPLYNMRHQLYVFLPVPLLAGLLAEAGLSRLKGCGARAALAAAAVAVYAVLNVRAAARFDSDVRTNDREWQFLASMQRRWPDGCVVVSPPWQERRGMLARLFPPPGSSAFAQGGCYLVYRSPYDQIFTGQDGASGASARREREAPLFSEPFAQETFAHRYYTNYGRSPATQKTKLSETWDPVPVTIGFYRLPEPVRALLAADASVLGETRDRYGDAQKESARRALAAARALPEPRGAGAALAAWDVRARARFLTDRAVLGALLGETAEASKDLRRALASAPGFPPAALSLGSLYESAGKRGEAAKVYDDALRVPAGEGDERLRGELADRRRGLASAR